MSDRPQILVVDDEMLSRDVLERLLTAQGFEVGTFSNGPSCMEWLEDQTADLVLLDVSMRDIDGLQVLRWIRQRQSPEQLPVILVSALVDSEDVVAGFEAGANDYIVKPVNPPVLLARIGVALKIRKSVERLVEAERYREKLQAIADACAPLSQPMIAAIEQLQSLVDELPTDEDEIRARLGDILDWARRSTELLNRFRKIASYRTVPYTEGMGGFISASLEEAVKESDKP